MPELPEVEVVRAGLARHVAGCTVTRVEVLDPRPLRRQDGGAQAFVDQLTGRTLTAAVRRGKFLWLPLDDGRALSAHLGMSGQLLVRGTTADASDTAPEPNRAAAFLADPDTLPGGRPADLSATEQPRYVRDISTSARHLRVRLHLSTGLGKHQGKRRSFRFQNQGEANPATREEVGNAAHRGLGDGHERTGPRDALGVLGATQKGSIGRVNSLEAAAGSEDSDRTGARKCSLVQVEDDVEAGGSGGGGLGRIGGHDLSAEGLKKGSELRI